MNRVLEYTINRAHSHYIRQFCQDDKIYGKKPNFAMSKLPLKIKTYDNV